MVKPVNSKLDFVRRYSTGEFGNHSPTWDSLSAWSTVASSNALYHIRNRVAGGPTFYNLCRSQVIVYWHDIVRQGVDPSTLYISEMAPTSKTLFQGEVQRGVWGYVLYYSRTAKPMRDALAEDGHSVSGIIASCLLRGFLCPRSYDWLMYLLNVYEGHVVEFSTYRIEWGTLAGYNTVYWEVRNY